MLFIFFQRDIIRQEKDFPIDADPDISVFYQPGQDLLVRPFVSIDDRCHDHDFFPVSQGHDRIGHLLDCLLADRFAAFRAERFPGAGIQQAQVVVDFRDSPDSRTGIAARRLLIDRNSR